MGDYRVALEEALDPELLPVLDAYRIEVEAELRRSEEAVTLSALARLLLDLHRCEHGRLEGDPCLKCGGPSKGNLLIPPGMRIGHTRHGQPMTVPSREDRNEPKNWLPRA